MIDTIKVKKAITTANKGFWDGANIDPYFESCKTYFNDLEAMVIFTRDIGHHESGWWKNPDFERCFHLSISFVDKFGNRKPKNVKSTEKLLKSFYGWNKKLIWSEPPYSENGIKWGVWHYRLFCDENWRAIKPRGEVYNKQFTDAGWLSYSDLMHNKLSK